MDIKFTRTIFVAICLVIITLACAGASPQRDAARAEAHALAIIRSYQNLQDTTTPEVSPAIPTLVALFTPKPASTEINLPSEIAYVSFHDNYWTFDIRSADGVEIRQLTNDPNETSPGGWFDYGIDWSPNGEKIAIMSNREGNDEIYVMNSDGTGEIKLTNNRLRDTDPTWSPDGKQLLFVSWEGVNAVIKKVNADGSEQISLTNNLQSNYAPAWSPDGEHITFASNRDGNAEIYSMNADGSEQTRLTYGSGFANSLTWSPSGDTIIFVSTVSDAAQIYVMKIDGSDLTPLTKRTSSVFNNAETLPTLSPDGKNIAFINLNSVCSVNADGSGNVFNYNTPDALGALSWSPDSKYIAFSSWNGIYVINTESSEIIQIVENPSALSPVWSPICINCP